MIRDPFGLGDAGAGYLIGACHRVPTPRGGTSRSDSSLIVQDELGIDAEPWAGTLPPTFAARPPTSAPAPGSPIRSSNVNVPPGPSPPVTEACAERDGKATPAATECNGDREPHSRSHWPMPTPCVSNFHPPSVCRMVDVNSSNPPGPVFPGAGRPESAKIDDLRIIARTSERWPGPHAMR